MKSLHITWYMPDVDTNVGMGSTQNHQLFQTVEKYCAGVQTGLHQTACLTNTRVAGLDQRRVSVVWQCLFCYVSEGMLHAHFLAVRLVLALGRS